MVNNQPTGFKDLLNSMMKRRWFITAIVLGGFMMIMAGIFAAIIGKNEIELVINNECARLLAICIIFYNASLLSGIYEYCKNNGMLEECKKEA